MTVIKGEIEGKCFSGRWRTASPVDGEQRGLMI